MGLATYGFPGLVKEHGVGWGAALWGATTSFPLGLSLPLLRVNGGSS